MALAMTTVAASSTAAGATPRAETLQPNASALLQPSFMVDRYYTEYVL